MDTNIILQMIFNGIGGLGIFLLGMKYMSEGMQAIAGKKLKQLIHLATNNRFKACAVGIFITCIIQSSSVTTVMSVGFVNSGLMTLNQAIGVIIGSNIGTTITGWLLALKVDKFGLPVIGIFSILFIFSKNDKIRNIAFALIGIGMLFFGLTLMSEGFKPMRTMPEFVKLFSFFQAESYFGVIKCILAGTIITAIIQSSSATLGITISLANAGVLEFHSAAAIVLGENIGTTITSFLSSLGVSTNAKRAAYSHMFFNIIGVCYMIIIFPYYIKLITYIIGNDPNTFLMIDGQKIFPHITKGIALSHSLFNLINFLLFVPFINHYANFIKKLVPEKKNEDQVERVKTSLNNAMIEPETALDVVELESLQLFKLIGEYATIVRNKNSNSVKNAHHLTYMEISKIINSFLISLLEKDISGSATERLINIMKRLDLYNSLEINMFKFSDILQNNNSPVFNDLFNNFLESMDILLISAFDTIKSKDQNDMEILNKLTITQSKLMSELRSKTYKKQINLSADEKSNLFQVTNLFEINVWLINNIGRFLDFFRVQNIKSNGKSI